MRPYWRYIHNDSVITPRPQHKAWGDAGLTLRHDHPFWLTHFPPNGWGCMCSVQAVRGPKAGDATEPPEGWDTVQDKTQAPPGIDKGWAYAPGANASASLQDLVDSKLMKLSPELAQALRKEARTILGSASAKKIPDSLGLTQVMDIQTTVNKLAFVEAKTTKAAGEWAVKNNLADFADYSGVKPEVANAWNKSLLDHLREFPELRANQKFTGTCQAQVALWREIKIDKTIAQLRLNNPQLPADFDFRPHAEKHVKPIKIMDKYAHSWMDPDVSGVAVNKKYGADVGDFVARLRNDVSHKWHPVGADTIRSVVDHELGHQLDALLGLQFDTEVVSAYNSAKLKGIKDEVSSYADKNIKEYIAECWAEVCNNPAPRAHARTIGEIVRARYSAKFSPALPAGGSPVRGGRA